MEHKEERFSPQHNHRWDSTLM